MDFDMVSKMKADELKMYLRLRGLKVKGRKAELVSRVFSACENNVQPIKTAEEVECDLRNEYQLKLIIGDDVIPDPFQVSSGWCNEEEGLTFWPMISYGDIFNFLMFKPSELGSSDLNDYKNSKAYSYFANGWLGCISYHNIDKHSKYCFLQADCRPSERLRDTPHKVWVCVLKSDHTIKTAHCSCMAGMSATCNHVAALLFRVEAAVRYGLTNPSCTAKSCEWLPNRQEVAPVKIKDVKLSRDKFGKRGKKTRCLVPTPKKNYNPLECTNVKPLNLTDIATALENHVPDSVLFTAVPRPKIDFVRDIVSLHPVSSNIPSIDDVIFMSNSIENFNENLLINLTKLNISQIEILTRGQNTNECWYSYRKGVITASKGHDVKVRMEKIRKNMGNNENLWQLFQKISGLVFVNPNIPALKYGREMEVNAVNKFKCILSETHKNVKIVDCGLYLDEQFPYIGASPDRIILCSCCPKACLEVKCPFSINYTTPYDPSIKLPYLTRKDDVIKLNRNHKYYTQCQMQLGVTGIKKSYFMVWTSHGYVIDEIFFDAEYWNNLKSLFADFYKHYLQSFYK